MAYPTEKAILDGFVSTLGSVTGLHALPYPSPQMLTPCVFPTLKWPLHQSYGRRAGPIEFELHVLVKWAPMAGQTLGEYTDPEGAKSITAAIQATPTLGVTGVTGTRVAEMSGPQVITLPGGESYWGRTIRGTVII